MASWAYPPGPLLHDLGQHLGVRDVLRARLVCKSWHGALLSAPVPACAVMPVPELALHSTSGSHPLSAARLLVLHCDEIRSDSLCCHCQQCDDTHSQAAHADAHHGFLDQVELLCKTSCALQQVRLQFWTAAFRLSAPPEDLQRAAAWARKVLMSLVLFAPHLRLLHIDLGKHDSPEAQGIALVTQLPCLCDFHLSCSSISAEHALVIVSHLKGLQALSLRTTARHRGEPWWASPALLGPAIELPRLTSLVLDAPGLLSSATLPSLVTSSSRLQKLELLRDPFPRADAGLLPPSAPFQSKLAPLLEMPALQSLSLSIRALSPADWSILSTLCERQLTLCSLNSWKLESGPRGLTALETPDIPTLLQQGASISNEPNLEHSQIGLGLSNCKVAKVCLKHPSQLPLLLSRGPSTSLDASLGRSNTGSRSCSTLEVLHLAFDDGHQDACREGSSDSPYRQQQMEDNCSLSFPRLAWSSIMGCSALSELNIARAHTLPLTDEVCAELVHMIPKLQVFQYNGCVELTNDGWTSLSSMPQLKTLAVGSIKPTESSDPTFVEFPVRLHQLPHQLQCLSLLNAAIYCAPDAAGFPPDLRQLSVKFCRLVDGLSPATRGSSDPSRLIGMVSKLSGLLHLHLSLDGAGSPDCWEQLARMRSLEDLTLVLGTSCPANTQVPLQVLHQVARIPNLQHLKFYAPSDASGQDLQFTQEDLDSLSLKLKYLRSLELGPLHSGGNESRREGMLHPTHEVAPSLASRLSHCRMKLMVNDILEAINSTSWLDQPDVLQETDDAGSETIEDPELNAELEALQLEEEA